MQGQTQISNVLALKPSPANASTDKGRSSAATQSGEDFRRMLDRPTASEGGHRTASAKGRVPDEVRNRDSQLRQEHVDQRRRQDAADQRRAEASDRMAHARTVQSEQNQKAHIEGRSQGAETRQSESASVRPDGPESGAVELADLSDDELKALGARIDVILSDLRAQLEAGELDADAEEALRNLLLALDEGAPVSEITQLLDALPVSLLPEGRDRFPSAKTLADLLGPSGAGFLRQLASEVKQGRDSGFSLRLNGPEEGPSGGLDKLMADQKGVASTSTKENFAQMVQAMSSRDGASARGADLSQAQTSPSAAANLEASARQQPLQPSERQFMVQSEVRVPVNQGQWGQAVGQRVLWLAAQNVTSAELRLDPPDLGPMQVRVTSHQDQISVTFTSPQVAVREALDQNATRLREMFAEQGLNLVDVNVSDQSDGREMAGEGGQGNRGQEGEGAEGDEPDSRVTERITATYLVDHYV